ncbi:MAG: ATP-binding protein [Pseudoflavonifractor sp.]|nr:ATP-binding protein [Alloprevotella sp.]MCM1116035.1 ATP-binding protein [Pseudoflavonifractor sp.]
MPTIPSKGQKLTLPVIADSYGYYTVVHNGKNIKVKKFDFQRYDKTPRELSCIVDRVSGDFIYLKQDMGPIFAARYKQGEVYEFTVEADMTMATPPHYKVTQEGLGYWIMLPARKNMKLSHGDKVRCRVGKIQGINLNLRIEEVVDRHGEPPMVLIKKRELADRAGKDAIDDLLTLLADEPRMVKALQMLKEKNPEWILEALRAGRDYLFSAGPQTAPEMVETLRVVAAYILEDTDLLAAFPAQRRLTLRDEMARLVSYCDDMLTALDIVAAGQQSQYISEMMSKLSASGYLYRPESRLRTMMCIFTLDPDSIDAKMAELIEIIHKGNPASWLAEPFRSAFIEQLQLYIDSCHTTLDNISEIDGDETERRLDKMLAALAIQQILADDRGSSPSAEGTSDEMAVNRSRLYRYFTFKGNCVKSRMIEKAFQVTLTGDIPEGEFNWDDTKDLGRLGRHLLAQEQADGSTYSYNAPRAALTVSPASIDLRIPGPEAAHPALPSRLDLWHGLQIWLPAPLPADKRSPRTILQFRDAYAIIRGVLSGKNPLAEAVITEPKSRTKAKAKEKAEEIRPKVRMLPDPGDLVDIIVEGVEDDTPGAERFRCRVVEDSYRGIGFLDRSNLTRGNGQLPLSIFADEEGHPYILKARVMACSSIDDTLSFSLIDELNRYVGLNVEPGTELNGVVIALPGGGYGFNADRFTVLTEHGYTAWVDGGDFSETITVGSNIALRIDSASQGGRVDVYATCIRSYVPERITFEDATKVLLWSYADEQIYRPKGSETPKPEPVEEAFEELSDDSAGQMDETLSDAKTGELMHIIARLADLETDMVKAYNYFSFAQLLADCLGLEAQALYYGRRCSIIEVLDEFASNGRVDLARVDSLSDMLIEGLPTSVEGQTLRLLAALDHPERTEKVWDVVRSTTQSKIEKLGRLILAYNAIDGFKLGPERRAIREQIYSELHMAPDILPEQIENGRESQTVEFKTSLIYPAGNSMRRDVDRQTREIVQIIAGFLNTAGGRLYIGVSDEGYVRGVAQDLEFFKSADKMDLHLMNAIDKYFKMVDRFRFIQSRWEEHDGKQIYIVDVKPTRIPIALEGVYFQRHSTSTRPVPQELEAQFLEARRDESQPLTYVTGIDNEAEEITESAVISDEPVAPIAPAVVAVSSPAASAPARRPEIEHIATSETRDNRDYDTCDGTPFHDPVSFFYITDTDGSFRKSPDNLWIDDSSRLSLRLREEEAEQDLIAVFASGHAIRLDYQRLAAQGRISGGDIVFLTPAKETDGLFIYFQSEDGRNVFKRFFPAEAIRRGDAYEQGDRLMPVDSTFLRALVVGKNRASSFARFERNGQRLSGGLADLDSDYSKTIAQHL